MSSSATPDLSKIIAKVIRLTKKKDSDTLLEYLIDLNEEELKQLKREIDFGDEEEAEDFFDNTLKQRRKNIIVPTTSTPVPIPTTSTPVPIPTTIATNSPNFHPNAPNSNSQIIPPSKDMINTNNLLSLSKFSREGLRNLWGHTQDYVMVFNIIKVKYTGGTMSPEEFMDNITPYLLTCVRIIERGKKMVILKCKNEKGELETCQMPFTDFKNTYSIANGYFVDLKSRNQVSNTLQVVEKVWLFQPLLKEIAFVCKGETVQPYTPLETDPSEANDYFNSFLGYQATLLSKYDGELIAPIIYHLREVWADGDEDMGDYILRWLAHIVRYPRSQKKSALIVIGSQGSGKTGLVEFFGKKIIGTNNYAMVENLQSLSGDFNSHHVGKLFVNVAEVMCGNTTNMSNSAAHKASTNAIKNLISDSTAPKKEKYVTTKIVSNNCFYLFTTNNDNPIYDDGSERRFAYVRCSNKYCKDKEYFDTFYSLLDRQDVADHFYTYLMRNPEFEGFDPTLIPMTEARLDCISQNLTTIQSLVKDFIEGSITEVKGINKKIGEFFFSRWYDDVPCLGMHVKTFQVLYKSQYPEMKSVSRDYIKMQLQTFMPEQVWMEQSNSDPNRYIYFKGILEYSADGVEPDTYRFKYNMNWEYMLRTNDDFVVRGTNPWEDDHLITNRKKMSKNSRSGSGSSSASSSRTVTPLPPSFPTYKQSINSINNEYSIIMGKD